MQIRMTSKINGDFLVRRHVSGKYCTVVVLVRLLADNPSTHSAGARSPASAQGNTEKPSNLSMSQAADRDGLRTSASPRGTPSQNAITEVKVRYLIDM